jgi:hypothetical protein
VLRIRRESGCVARLGALRGFCRCPSRVFIVVG